MTKWLTDRLCLWCGAFVPEGEGVLHWPYRALLHQGRCQDLVECLERDFAISARGRIRRAGEVRRLMDQVRGKPPHQWIDYRVLCHLEPGLHALLATAQFYHRQKDERFCANEAWYGYGEHTGRGLKQALLKLVGYERVRRHTVLSAPFAYDLAYDTIYDALPDCRGACACIGVGQSAGS